MLASMRNFAKRHRTNIAIGVGLVGAAYFYARSKFSETKDRMSSERIARENLKRRFEQNQEDCSYTVLALLPTAADSVIDDLPVEKLTQELQQKKADRLAKTAAQKVEASNQITAHREDDNQSLQSFASESHVLVNGATMEEEKPKKTRAQLWNEIKISSITRAFTLIYTLALLTILTRVQLNLLGRKNYLSSVVSLAERDDQPTISLENNDSRMRLDGNKSSLDDETNRQYLTFSWWFLHKGWRKVKDRVEEAVKQVFGPYTPRDTITLSQLTQLTTQFRTLLEQNPTWLPYLLPTRDDELTIYTESGLGKPSTYNPLTWPSPALRKMLDETSDFLDSPSANIVMGKMLDAGFGLLVEQKLGEGVFRAGSGNTETAPSSSLLALPMANTAPAEGGAGQASDPSTKVASVLAVLTRQAHIIGSGNEYLHIMEQPKELEAFSALVYSNFENLAQRDDCASLSS